MASERDIRLTFDTVAEAYGRARPSYPSELFDEFFAVLPANPRVIEIGPGTGQATVDLLARGAHVTAVELGPSLGASVRARFAAEERLSVVIGAFEDVELAVGEFDAVVVATAYHWIDKRAQVERPLELLRPDGALGVIDLIQVDSASDRGYFERVQPIYERYGQAKQDEPKHYDTVAPKIAAHLEASGRYASVDVHRVRWDQTYTAASYRDLLWSYSGTQMMPEPERSRMLDELVGVVSDEFDDEITRPLVATLTLARP